MTPAEYIRTIRMLEGESTVPAYLLVEDDDLVSLIKEGKDYKTLLAWVNDNF